MFALFSSFPFVPFFALFWQRYPSKIISFGGSSTTVRSFYILEFYFLSTPSLSFQKSQNWWIIHLRVSNSISKTSIAYVFYKPPQSDTIINLRHLAWTSLSRLRFVITSASNPPRLGASRHHVLHPSSTLWRSVIVTLRNPPHSNITVVVLFLGLGVPHTFSRFLLSIIPSVILCSRTHLCCSLCSGYACICWRTNKNS